MNNRDIQEAWKYHDGTKHSYWSIRNNPHSLDWANRPQPFKIYPKPEPFPLPRDLLQTGVAALSAISEEVSSSRADSVPDLQDLARILYFSAGITKQRRSPGGEIYFRAAACTGAQWRGKQPVVPPYAPPGEGVRLQPSPEEEQPKDTIEQVILRRGSTRAFDKTASITLAQLSTILDYATRGLPADFLKPPGEQLNDLYLIVHSVQGLKPGAYFFRRDQNILELLREGEFRAEAHHLGLEQELPADACVDIFFLADLKPILERYGNRGYRAVQLEAGAIGGRIYLAAYAQHLGATGLTFFDDDVVSFFSPHAKDKSAIFLLAMGKPRKRKPQ